MRSGPRRSVRDWPADPNWRGPRKDRCAPVWPGGYWRDTLHRAQARLLLLDPVCGMTVRQKHVRHLAEHDGVVYAFCSLGCRTSFVREPAAYLAPPVPSDA